MVSVAFIRNLRAKLDNHLHYNVTAENWEKHYWLIEAMKDIDAQIKALEEEFDEHTANETNNYRQSGNAYSLQP